MIRLFALLAAAFSTAMPTLACEISSDTARAEIAAYVSEGLICLDAPPEGYRFDLQMEQAFIDKINSERREHGLLPLSIREELLAPARLQSLDLGVNNTLGHASSDGRTTADRIAALDRTLLAQSFGENISIFAPAICFDQNDAIASCDGPADFEVPTSAFVVEDLHKKLMNSEGHQANILSESFSHLAVGVARTDVGFYVTQLFANPMGELAAPLPTEFEINSAIAVSPNLKGWDFSGYAVVDAAGDHAYLDGDTLERLPPGEKTLVVIGENTKHDERGSSSYVTTDWIYLTGPSFTLKPATGS